MACDRDFYYITVKCDHVMEWLILGKFDWGSSVRNYFSVRTILNSAGCCKLPRLESSNRGLSRGEIGK